MVISRLLQTTWTAVSTSEGLKGICFLTTNTGNTFVTLTLKCAKSEIEVEHNYYMLRLQHPLPLLPHVTLWIIIIHETLNIMWGARLVIEDWSTSIFCKVTLFLLHLIVSFYLLYCMCYLYVCIHMHMHVHVNALVHTWV